MTRTITPHKGNRNKHFPGTRVTQTTQSFIAAIIAKRNECKGDGDKRYTVADWIEEKAREDAIRLGIQVDNLQAIP